MQAKFEIYADDEIIRDASQIFEAIGMDLQMAVNIFLRRTASEKAFPLSMNAQLPKQVDRVPAASENSAFEHSGASSFRSNQPQRANTSITHEMVVDVWDTFMEYLNHGGEINRLSDGITARSGMTRGSAFIYLCILNNLVNGEYNTRNMKIADLEYYLDRIEKDLNEQQFTNALASLEQSIPYWREKIPGTFADNVEELVKSKTIEEAKA